MTLTKEKLLLDLYVAYYDARKHKAARSYVRHWEKDLKANMDALCDDLLSRTYKPLPSKCFIVDYPKKREIFAAVFRDRIVHHLYFNYTHQVFERTFIADSYSCIKGRGTHYGIRRVTGFLRKESRNWQRPCYAMHIDIRGYFMHIDRQRLLKIAVDALRKMSSHRSSAIVPDVSPSGRWSDILDLDFLYWLTEVIVMLDPKEDCILVGDESDWTGLDPAKSMLNQPVGLGLPIGNLTSQLFSNVYLNEFDQFVKRTLGCRYYGRYVDDAVLISSDREWLISLVPRIEHFLKEELGLELHMGKLHISEVHKGVEFLGAYVKPWRTYVSRRTLERMKRKMAVMDYSRHKKAMRSINSYLGLFQHTDSYRIRRSIFMRREFLELGVFNQDMTKITDRIKFYKPLKNKRL
jgi:retron-type reverse transcriptase